MTLEEQHRFLLDACKRLFPRWLQGRTSPEDVAQDALLHCWQWSLKGVAVDSRVLRTAARQKTIDACRRHGRRFTVPMEFFDAPAPEPEEPPEPEMRALAQAVLGPTLDRLLQRNYVSPSAHRAAVHRAKLLILKHLRSAS